MIQDSPPPGLCHPSLLAEAPVFRFHEKGLPENVPSLGPEGPEDRTLDRKELHP
jgi:hypothetical protein